MSNVKFEILKKDDDGQYIVVSSNLDSTSAYAELNELRNNDIGSIYHIRQDVKI